MRLHYVLFITILANICLGAPPNFEVDGKRAVFVDFISAHYNIVYDVASETATAVSEISFNMPEEGYPIFDLVSSPKEIYLDKKLTDMNVISAPSKRTKYRLVQKSIKPGVHSLKIKSDITLLRFSEGGVNSGFFMTDLSDSCFLERYLPSNLEYDQYEMYMNINVLGTKKEHVIYTNTLDIKKLKKNSWEIKYPKYFTASSLYFHLTPKGYFKERRFRVKSLNGNEIPAVLYGQEKLVGFFAEWKIKRIMRKLQKDFGKWPHPNLVIYYGDAGFGLGGMEHAGATITDPKYILHELTHSYLGRGFFPEDGDSGWLDEALTSWYSNTPRTPRKADSYFPDNFFSGPYNRVTMRSSYSMGARFIAFLNHRFSEEREKFKPWLKKFTNKFMFKTVNTVKFKNELEASLGVSFDEEFKKIGLTHDGNYVYAPDFIESHSLSEKKSSLEHKHKHKHEHPIHKKLTAAQVIELM